jgi:hypothetical protein
LREDGILEATEWEGIRKIRSVGYGATEIDGMCGGGGSAGGIYMGRYG